MFQSFQLLLVLKLFDIISQSNAQTCLESPKAVTHTPINSNDIYWIEVGTNEYMTTLVYDVSIKTWQGPNVRLTTRLHNDSMPSPTLRMKRGNKYNVKLINNLGAESIYNPIGHNHWKDPNTTNLHTHGLHIGGQYPGDSVFVTLNPGEEHTYQYYIPCNHCGGTHWYHPHHHGSTYFQVGGGTAGGVIVEDDADMEGLSSWYTNMEELIIMISRMDIGRFNNDINTTFDYVWNWEKPFQGGGTGLFFLINGEYQPTICMNAGEWLKLRIIHHEVRQDNTYIIPGCQLKLLARDGVIVRGLYDTDLPRDIDEIWLAPPNRADVAIHCPGDVSGTTTYSILWNGTSTGRGILTIGYIQVTGTIISPVIDLTPFTPIRPDYLEDLLNYNGNLPIQQHQNTKPPFDMLDYFTVHVTAADIGGQSFINETSYLTEIGINTINEFRITMGNLLMHPFHMHVNHFQIHASEYQAPYGHQMIGDWGDVLFGPGTIKFKTDIWGGTITLHCHILEHEDHGAMGTIKVTQGCDNDLITDFGGTNVCTYDTSQCEATRYPSTKPTQKPTTTNTPTKIPTNTPTNNPTSIPTQKPTKKPTTDTPTKIPTITPTNNPTSIPTNLPSKTPSIKPSRSPLQAGQTFGPTDTPTNIPSNTPTKYPTNFPSVNPTLFPTNFPTVNPTSFPSKNPTNMPSENPSQNTNVPTQNTETPSNIPIEHSSTNTPSIMPTNDNNNDDDDQGQNDNNGFTKFASQASTFIAESFGVSSTVAWVIIVGIIALILIIIIGVIACCCWRHKKEQIHRQTSNNIELNSAGRNPKHETEFVSWVQ